MRDRVLIVDNDESILRSLNVLLEPSFEVISAASGKEALEILDRQKVECIVSDFEMEDGDGLFLLKNLKRKEIPFILVTGHGDKDLFKSFANERSFFIFEKPVTTHIVSVVKTAVERYHKAQREMKERLIGKNAGHILHDLDNGLAIIETSASAGLSQAPPEVSKFLAISLKAARKIASMVSKYKTFMNENADIQLSTLSLKTFVEELKREVEFTNHGIQFRLQAPKEEPCLVTCDPDLVRQVLLNLVSNSLFAIRDQARPYVEFRLVKEKGVVLLAIEDSGSLTKEISKHLFSEGFSTKGDKGTGMGLFYAKEILKKMNASIRLTNRKPTTFEIQFEALD